VPFVPLVPILSLLATVWLSLSLTWSTWRNLGLWMAAGLVVYLVYGRRHSALGNREEPPPAPPAPEPGALVVRAPGAHRAGYR
jgi:APA family basic amino acid/polyamine antiporter